jgi:zinc transport system substrate-binding protein
MVSFEFSLYRSPPKLKTQNLFIPHPLSSPRLHLKRRPPCPNFFPFRRTALLLASSVAVALGSCAPGTTDVAEVESPEKCVATVDLTVMTTILPITQFTNAVVGDRAEVIPLMPTNVDPHDFQASPAGCAGLGNADVLVKNGLEMEFFLDDLIANAENPDLVMIDSSEGIAVVSNEAVEGHSHGKADDHDHGHDHDHDHDHDHGEAEAATAADHDRPRHAEGGTTTTANTTPTSGSTPSGRFSRWKTFATA